MISSLKRLLRLIPEAERPRWIGVVVLASVVAALELVGAMLVLALLGLVTSPEAVPALPIVGPVDELLPGLSRDALIISVALTVAAFFVVRGLLAVGQAYVQGRLAHRTGTALSTQLFDHYLAMPYDQHVRLNSADLIRNTHSAVSDVVDYGFVPIVRIVSSGLIAATLTAVLVIIAPLPTAFVAVLLLPPIIVLLRVVQPRLTRLGHQAQEVAAGIVRTLQESLHGFREVRVLGIEDSFRRIFSKHRGGFEDVQAQRAAIAQLPGAFIQATLIGIVTLLLTLAVLRGEDLQRTLALLGLFAYTAMRLLPSLGQITVAFNDLRYGAAVLEIIESDLADSAAGTSGFRGEVLPLELQHELVLDRVTYTYPGSTEPAVADVSLVIPKGRSIGVVGATGAGKSTLVDLLLGLLAPSSGSIQIDGLALADESTRRRWQAALGVVPQHIFLIDGSLRANIALGSEDDVDEEALTRAVEMAQLGVFVEELPERLETRVGERGVRLSGGQRQRVAIARALYRDPAVLIFDEGTSALDNATEAELVAAIERLRADRTIVTVAHRLTTVERCDQIIVLEGGRLIASGTYEELAAVDETFQRLARQR